MNIKENKDPWYLKTITLIVLLIICLIKPVAAIILIPLICLKSQRYDKYYKYLSEILPEAQETASTIIKDAQLQAQSIIDGANNEISALHSTAQETHDKNMKVYQEKEAELSEKIADKEAVMEQIINEANAEAQNKLTLINSEIEKKDSYYSEILSLKEEIDSLDKKIVSRQNKISNLTSIQKSVNHAIKNYFKHATTTDEQIILPAELIKDIETMAPAVTLKLHYMDYADLRKAFKANEKIIADVLSRYEGRYTTKTNRAIYQLMVIALQSELQNVLYTLTYSKLNDAIDTIKNIINKYLNIARDGSQTISSTLAKFIGELEPLFIDAVKIEYEYYVKKEAARQEQLALREQMRQEAEDRKLLKQQQEQIEKEESKYKAEIQNIQEQLKTSEDSDKTNLLLAKIKELESQLNNVEKEKENIVNLQNGRAGYVYVISNLGSFGDDVFKVGMTRRLNPQDRIDELGSASVPFTFDVHSFIFSENAVQLESDLHDALDANRLNKVNPRKEFFKISLEDIEKLVEKFDPTAEFNMTMEAEQYRQSLSASEDVAS